MWSRGSLSRSFRATKMQLIRIFQRQKLQKVDWPGKPSSGPTFCAAQAHEAQFLSEELHPLRTRERASRPHYLSIYKWRLCIYTLPQEVTLPMWDFYFYNFFFSLIISMTKLWASISHSSQHRFGQINSRSYTTPNGEQESGKTRLIR